MDSKQRMIAAAGRLVSTGLWRGTAGNLSVRAGHGFLITPTGLAPERLGPEDLVLLDMDGTPVAGDRRASSEWRMHRDVYAARPEIGAVVHTHSMFATTFACLRREVPAMHYMIAITGDFRLACADYASFGSQELSDAALVALQHSRACLLANHGALALGESLEEATRIAEEVETLCELYWRTLQIGPPRVLNTSEMLDVLRRFRSYGQQPEAAPEIVARRSAG